MAQARTPQILEVSRDYLKPDAVAANRKLERRAEDLCRTLGFTHPYLTIESVSGPAEMWYLNGFDSEAEVEKLRREYQQNTKLLAALDDITRQKVPLKRLESTDEFVNYRPDFDLTGEICTKWNERESTWRKSGSCQSRGTSQSRS